MNLNLDQALTLVAILVIVAAWLVGSVIIVTDLVLARVRKKK
jgi:hypothetical protein